MKLRVTYLIIVLNLIVSGGSLFCDQYQSTVSGGNWSDPSVWKKSTNGGKSFSAATTIPGLKPTDSVVIKDGASLMFDTSVTISVLAIGDGSSGLLTFDSSGFSRKLILLGNLIVKKGAQFITPRHGLRANHVLEIAGNVYCDGRMNLTVNPQVGYCNTVFNGIKKDQLIDGAGKDLVFRGISVAKDTVSSKVICRRDIIVMGGTISFVKGTWEQTSGLLTNNTNQLIQPNGALVINGSASFNKVSYGLTIRGLFHVETTGKVKLGTFTGKATVLVTQQGRAEFISGDVSVGGQLKLDGGATTIAGANLQIDPQSGNKPLPATLNVFDVSGNANLTFTSGQLRIANPLIESGAGREISISSKGKLDLSGSTIILGDSSSVKAGKDGFEMENIAHIPFHNLIIQTGKGTGRTVTLFSDIQVDGTLRYLSGDLVRKSTYKLVARSTSDDR